LHGEDFKSNRPLLWRNQRLRLAGHGRARAPAPHATLWLNSVFYGARRIQTETAV
jgi:hypothetical protein